MAISLLEMKTTLRSATPIDGHLSTIETLIDGPLSQMDISLLEMETTLRRATPIDGLLFKIDTLIDGALSQMGISLNADHSKKGKSSRWTLF